MRITTLIDRCAIVNCVQIGAYAFGVYDFVDIPHDRGADVSLTNNTLISTATTVTFSALHDPFQANRNRPAAPTRIKATRNVFDANLVLGFGVGGDRVALVRDEAGSYVRPRLSWQDQENLHSIGGCAAEWYLPEGLDAPPPVTTLDEWKQFWNEPDAEVLEGVIRYQGGALISRLDTAPEGIIPQDFRLRPDSAGYQAGPDGRDLGADVDLVGPGAAYERWKQTPEYQQWLADTGQRGEPGAILAERGAFVVLGGETVAERKFDTLAEAVLGASDGDTIEIRGNGPFVTDRITINHPLRMRAGAGFRPVLRRSAPSGDGPLFFAEAALVLEGLTLECEAGWFLGTREYGPPALLMANCRLTSHKPVELIWHRALRTQMRNCELIGGNIAVDWNCRTGGSHLIENCVIAAPFGISYGECAETDVDLHDVSVTFRKNTVTGPAYAGLAIGFGAIPTVADGIASIAMEVERNVFAGSGRVVHAVYFVPQDHGETTNDMVAALNRLVAWHARQNLCATHAQFLSMQLERTISPPPRTDQPFWRPFDLTAADNAGIDQTFWGLTEAGIDRGDIRFTGGDLAARNLTDLARLSPIDFRLRADSAGYQAGPDGRDLGADVDLVGPGAAYERWKQTPEYQQWLDELAGVSPAINVDDEEKGARPAPADEPDEGAAGTEE